MKKQKVNLESISLGDLSAICQSEGGIAYKKIVNQVFAGRDNLFARNRLSSRWPLDLKNETKMNSETIHATELVLKGEQIKIDILQNQYVQKKTLYDKKYEEFLGIKRELDQLDHDLSEIKQQLEKQYASKKRISREFSKLDKISQELTNIVLVHNSATVNQLKKYQHRKMVILKSDVPSLEPIGICDEVFSNECHVIDIPYDMADRTPEIISAIEFVNMMFYFKIQEDVSFDAIYSDEFISRLLRFNKFDEF